MNKKIRNNTAPLLVTGSNLSAAWSEVFIHIIDHPGTHIAPLVLSITGFDENGFATEDAAVRCALDAALTLEDQYNIEDVAYTIFPQRLWTMAKGSRKTLFEFYRMAFPAYKAANRSLNRKGLYFERLVNYGRGPKGGNQLEWILLISQKYRRQKLNFHDAAESDPYEARCTKPCAQHT